MKARSRATRSDIARAVRAAHSVKLPCAVEIAPDGTIRIVPVDLTEPEADHDPFMEGIANAQAKKGRRHAAA